MTHPESGLCFTAPRSHQCRSRAGEVYCFRYSVRHFFLVATASLAPAMLAAEATPDIENGRSTFNIMCNVCHSAQETGGSGEGPNFIWLVGRQAGSQPAFTKYSEALKASGLTWSTHNLDKFLVNPMAMVPGTFMPMRIADDKTRADVIAWLATLKPQEASE